MRLLSEVGGGDEQGNFIIQHLYTKQRPYCACKIDLRYEWDSNYIFNTISGWICDHTPLIPFNYSKPSFNNDQRFLS